MNELYSWATISTLAGAAMITYLIVAYTKELRWVSRMRTDLYAVIVATIVLLCALGAQGQLFGWAPWVLCFFNGFLVAAAAGKVNDKAITEYERKLVEPLPPDDGQAVINTPPPETGSLGNTDGM